MRVKGVKEGHAVHILIDSGSTHDFLDISLAKKLGCKIEEIPAQSITIADVMPVNIRPYRYPLKQRDIIEQLIQKMLDRGIIQDSSKLNSKTVKNKFPIPVIDELIDELAGSSVFSKLDLRAGYHQLRVQQQDVYKTAFKTHTGHYEFLVMPFGLTNAPASFQNWMNSVKNLTEHWKHLESVFELMKEHCMYDKGSKCIFASNKKNAFKWSEAAQNAFEALKLALVSAPVLAVLDFSKTFVVETDASKGGIGAVLMQNKHPLAYISRSLGPKWQKLSIVYNQSPPLHLPYLPGESSNEALDRTLQRKEEMINRLKYNLERAQHRMKQQADLHRSDRNFKVVNFGHHFVIFEIQPIFLHRVGNYIFQLIIAPSSYLYLSQELNMGKYLDQNLKPMMFRLQLQ
ncbi:hypothetical protein DCAR_0623406 [Daucus carota subsp. sativus]|uniref:Reverse transcriptase/retrotransposon-derived protein RNase H-like domain-containing protein n=1 Tax=Daucus carota subsp. sativus TaxID=79200 RepID=A0AAF0X957_DAUCS|nr:hypothetical protein DCAR_0623406 [Daucus carota subsp. sativus]